MPFDVTKIADFFDQAASRHPDAPFLLFGDETVSYAQARRRSAAITNDLIARGYERKRIALASPNHPSMVLALLGLSRAGCTWVPINPLDTPSEGAAACTRAQIDLLLYHSASEAIAARVATRCAIARIDTEPGEIGAGAPETAVSVRCTPEELSDISFTGGTTGEPKLIATSHRVVEAMITTMLLMFRPAPEHRYLIVTPFTHAAGAAALPFAAVGAALAFTVDSKPATILAAIARHRITHVFLPPTLIYALLNEPALAHAEIGSLRAIIYGSSPIAEEKLLEALQRFGPIMQQCYGQSEAAMICTFLSADDHAAALAGSRRHLLRSAGRPTPLVRVGIMDDGGHLLPSGARGEIVVRGALVVPGYLNDPEATAATQAYGWHHTGDIGFKDADDYLYVVDRKKDMIISGALNIFPSDIEQALMSHPDIASCAVIGVPHERWGEAVTAIVALKPGASCDERTLATHARGLLGSVKAPKSIHIRDRLPTTKVGKIDKRALRAEFWANRERGIN